MGRWGGGGTHSDRYRVVGSRVWWGYRLVGWWGLRVVKGWWWLRGGSDGG